MVEVERAKDSDRHQWAMKALTTFAANPDVPKSIAMKVTGLRAEYETLFANFTRTKGYLAALPKDVPAANQFLLNAAAAVATELHPDTLGRLEMFTTLADRAAKDVKDGKKPAHNAAELLAAAVTGWHLGKVSAEPKVDLAYRCWTAREMALEYPPDSPGVRPREDPDRVPGDPPGVQVRRAGKAGLSPAAAGRPGDPAGRDRPAVHPADPGIAGRDELPPSAA